MWLPWGSGRKSDAGAGDRRLLRHLSATSFKDIDSLLPPPIPTPVSTAASRTLANPNPTTTITSHPDSPVIHRTFSLRSSRRDSFDFSHSNTGKNLPKQIIVYSTSFRAVRKTFDDCCTVLAILRGLRISFDERDVSMDSRFLAELRMLVGRKNKVSLPQVFIGGRWIGGAEEVRKLHESGELRRIVEGAPMAGGGTCRACGGVRFVVCGTCEGSHRLFSEKMGKFRGCAMCNENGLVRCELCVKAV